MASAPSKLLHEALREFPRYNTFLSSPVALDLSVPEAHVLLELDGKPGVKASDLVRSIDLEPPVVSRTLSNLQERGYVRISVSSEDARIRNLEMTAAGQRQLEMFDREANANLEAFDKLARFTAKDRNDLRSFLTELADGIDAPPSSARKGEHPLRQSIRRLTRAFGLLRNQSFGTQLTVLKWQALLEVYEASEGASIAGVSRALAVPESTAGEAIKGLLRDKLLRKTSSQHDARTVSILSSAKGEALISEVCRFQAANIDSAFGGRTRVLSDFVGLAERWVAAAAAHHYTTGGGVVVAREQSELDLQNARKLIAQDLLTRPFFPSTICDPKSSILTAIRDERVCAVVEFFESQNRIEVINAASASEDDTELLKALLWIAANNRQVRFAPHMHWFAELCAYRPASSILGRAVGRLSESHLA